MYCIVHLFFPLKLWIYASLSLRHALFLFSVKSPVQPGELLEAISIEL